ATVTSHPHPGTAPGPAAARPARRFVVASDGERCRHNHNHAQRPTVTRTHDVGLRSKECATHAERRTNRYPSLTVPGLGARLRSRQAGVVTSGGQARWRTARLLGHATLLRGCSGALGGRAVSRTVLAR